MVPLFAQVCFFLHRLCMYGRAYKYLNQFSAVFVHNIPVYETSILAGSM